MIDDTNIIFLSLCCSPCFSEDGKLVLALTRATVLPISQLPASPVVLSLLLHAQTDYSIPWEILQ